MSVLDTIAGIDPEWVGVQRLIRVQREGIRANKPFEETVFYISSLCLDAAGFAAQIQQHWHIENRLHWPKDVVLKEDEAPLCDGYALANESYPADDGTQSVSSGGFPLDYQRASTFIS